MCYRLNRRPNVKQPLGARRQQINRVRSRSRARGEHPLRVIKQLWGFAKLRYRNPANNLTRAQTIFALARLTQRAAAKEQSWQV